MTGKPSLKCLTAFLCLLLINASHLFAQEKIVTGKVKDPQGNPLPGVNVNVWGSRQSVTADVTGAFSIPVPSETSTLVFSFVGFLQKEVKVGDQKDIQVTMSYDNADLDQVVVVGYGTQRRRDLTGSVYSVKPSTITQTPTFNALEALQGRVPGLDISRSGGAAGQGVTILLRGQRTFSVDARQQQPLFIIDGFQGGSIADLNPNDIESVEVLKDASATAIYGWEGANGVIIVTTKKGKERPKVSYSGFYGVNGSANYPKSRIGDDYVTLRREAWKNGGPAITSDEQLFPNAAELAAYKAGQWTDWLSLIREDGIMQSHSISIQSGGDKTKVFFSTGYYKEEGTLRGNVMDRYNARLNYDQRISNVFKAGLLTQMVYVNHKNRQDITSNAANMAPLGLPYDSAGKFNLFPLAGGKVSPLADEQPNVYKSDSIRGTLNVNGYIEFTPINGLSFKSNLGTTISYGKLGEYRDSLSFNGRNSGLPSQSAQYSSLYRVLNWDNILTFTRKIEDHSITLMGLTSYITSISERVTAAGQRQLLPTNGYYDLGANEQNNRTIGSYYQKWNTMSYAGRVNYSYKGKYLLTATMRADGASRLSEGNKWHYFPSAGIGWNIHQEDFMGNALFVNNLKIRATYGLAGNASLNPYQTQNVLTPYNQNFGDVNAPAYGFSNMMGNANLTWEKTSSANLALDFAFFKSRLFGSIEVYKSTTTDILYKRQLPQSTGITEVWQNVGETETKGLELAISSVNVSTPDLRWTTTITGTAGREEITKLIDGKNIIAATTSETTSLLLGHPVNSYYTFQKVGIWQNDEAAKAAVLKFGGTPFKPGDIKLIDQNNDSIIDATNDRTFVGTGVPKWYAGFQNTFSYKGFELSVYMFARWGQTIYAQYMGRYNPGGLGNGPAAFDYWTPDNPSNDFPRPKYNSSNFSDYNGYQAMWFVDGSYFKVKTVTLGYTLPTHASRRIFAEKIRIYATGNNIFTKTKNKYLKDYDPERGGEESAPLTKQVVVGVNVDF